MIVIAGKRVVRRHLGWVGEFCPICRALECIRVTRLAQVSHVYYVPMGKAKAVAHELECRGCETVFGTNEVPYAEYARRPEADVVSIIATTNPDSVERHSERLDLEDRIGDGQLTSDERLGLIAEPLLALNYIATRKIGKGMIPTAAGFCIVFLVFMVPAAVISWATPGTPFEVRLTVSAVVAMLLAGTVLGFKHGGRGWMRRYLLPRLSRALAPLRPSFEELEIVLAELSRQKLVIGRRLRTEDLFAAVERARAS